MVLPLDRTGFAEVLVFRQCQDLALQAPLHDPKGSGCTFQALCCCAGGQDGEKHGEKGEDIAHNGGKAYIGFLKVLPTRFLSRFYAFPCPETRKRRKCVSIFQLCVTLHSSIQWNSAAWLPSTPIQGGGLLQLRERASQGLDFPRVPLVGQAATYGPW
jgi:hypothetical protein